MIELNIYMGVLLKGFAAINHVWVRTTAPAIPVPAAVSGSVIILDTRYISVSWLTPTDASIVQGSISGGPWFDLTQSPQDIFFAPTGPQYFSFRAVNARGVAGPVSTYPFNRTP